MVAIASPFAFPLTIALVMWFGIFIAIPLKLIFHKIKTWMLVSFILGYGVLAWWSSPLSHMATKNSTFNHCGAITYTGTFYPISEYLSDAHRDDLEARNQMCWVRKMISRVPDKFDTEHEIITYSKITQDKLLSPELKYRVALPLIAILYVRINASASNLKGAMNIYDSLHFWIDHYTEEINQRNYSAWNWPHSDYIKFEYGIIEKNWQKLIDNIVVEQT